MAKDVRVVLRLKGLNQLMTSAPVQAEVNKRAARVAAAAGPKYRMVVRPHRWTARAFVEPVDGARVTDDDQRRLLGGLDAGR